MLELPASKYPVVPLPTSFEIAKICAGLVSLVPNLEYEPIRKQVTFIHHTLKDYLMSDNIGSPEAGFFAISKLEAQKLISHISLGYLLSAIEDAPLSITKRANLPLLEYVLGNWYKHMEAVQKFVPVPEPTLDRAVKLLDARHAPREHSDYDRLGLKAPEGPEALYLNSPNFPPPLYYASLLGLVDVVQKLLLRGDQHHDSGDYFGTPLQAAAYGGHWPVIKELVGKGVDVNAISGFYGSALQAASYSGQYYAAGQLLASGADVNCLSGHYGTPLQAAAYGGHEKLILLLYLSGGKDNIQGGVYGCALVAAVQGGHEEVMMLLLKNATNVNAEGNNDIPNALYGASAKGHRSMVAKLLNYGADPDKCDELGRSALEAAIQGGYPDVVQLLLDNRATLNRASSTGLSLGIAALQMAAQGGHRDLVQRLLRWRAVNVNYQDKDGLSPFLMAVVRGYEAIVHLLLVKGVDTTLTDKDGLTALMMAVKGGYQSLVVLLLKYEADVTARNKDGQTPLMLAVEEGHEAIAFLLLQRGATTDAPDRSGRRPLDVAVSKGHQTIEKLLNFGLSATAIADRDHFWRSFSRIQTLPDEQKDCQELEATSDRDSEKYIP